MVVDVDEHWVANPFHTKIERFLAAHTETEADVISSNWLHCHRANLFDNPLDLSNTRLELTNKFKSLFRYGIPVSDLGAHVPYVLDKPKISHISSDGQAVADQVVNGVRKLGKKGIQACIHTTNRLGDPSPHPIRTGICLQVASPGCKRARQSIQTQPRGISLA